MIQTAIERPIAVTIIFVLVVGIGLYSSLALPVDLYPEINPPVLLVQTSYPAAGPQEVEESISVPLEGAFGNVPNITEIRSISYAESSNIILSFDWGYDIHVAANDVRDRLEGIKRLLPDDAAAPQIFKFDPNQLPVVELKLFGERSAEELRAIAKQSVIARLERVPGVALVSVSGGREQIVQIEIPRSRLDAYNLTFDSVRRAILAQNSRISAGAISEGNVEYQISTEGEFGDLPSIEETIIAAGTPPVLLRDVATTTFGYQDPEGFLYINGEPGLLLSIQKQSGVNSVETVDTVLDSLDDVRSILPPGVALDVSYDSTQIIRTTITQVAGSALYGGILATLILLFFLRNIRATMVIAFSIPISVIVTLMLMYFAGLTLNIMSLTGLAVGIGMLVDNSIVILENIYRYRERGTPPQEAALLGAQEVIRPITASTLTTICVFAPIIAFKSQLEILGVLFSDLAFTVVISLSASWFTAVFLVPTLASSWLPFHKSPTARSRLGGRVVGAIGRILEGITNTYRASLQWALAHRLSTIIAAVLLLGGSVAIIPIIGFQFLPSEEEDNVEISVRMPVGTTLVTTQEVLNQLEEYVKENITGYADLVVSVGGRSFLGNSRTHRGSLTINLPPFEERTMDFEEIQRVTRRFFDTVPAARFGFGQQEGGRGLGFNAAPIDIVVSSNDYQSARRVANTIRDILAEQPEVKEPRVDIDQGLPELDIFINRERAYSFGLDIQSIGNEIRAHVAGVSAGTFREGSNNYDILIGSAQSNRDEVLDLEQIYVLGSTGARVALSNFANFRRSSGAVEINREDQQRAVHVTASLAPGARVTEVEPRLLSLIQREIPAEEGLLITFSGEYAELQSYFLQFLIIMLIAVALVFGIMGVQFESFRDPFIIFCSIPFLLVGVIVIYTVGSEPFSMFGAVGLVMLAGIVVNNGIVLVDYTNLLLQRGRGAHQACLEGGVSRLRPILMTTLTTTLGLMPIAFFQGENATLVQPIAKTVVGGLLFNTVVSLFLVPILASLIKKRVTRAAPAGQEKSAVTASV